MKIALVSSGSGSRGGGEIYLRFLAQGLTPLGHEVLALVPDATGMDDLANSLTPWAEVTRFVHRPTYTRKLRTLGAWRDTAGQAALAQRFAALEVDILHINQQVAEDGLDLVLAARASGKPWVSTIHVGHSAKALGARLGACRDWVTKQALTQSGGDFIAISAASRDQLAARFKARLHLVLNGVPVPAPGALAEARKAARAEWGASDADIVIGAVGRIEAQKAPLALVDHVAPLAVGQDRRDKGGRDKGGRDKSRIRLVWIGDGAMRGALEQHAANVAPKISLHVDGWRNDAGLRMAGLDIFAMPSVFEGLPLALLEAMHAGLPIVASHADGIAEAIRPGENGFLCSTAPEWQAALSSLVDDASLRAGISATAQKEALARFSTDAMAKASVAVYTKVLARGPQTP